MQRMISFIIISLAFGIISGAEQNGYIPGQYNPIQYMFCENYNIATGWNATLDLCSTLNATSPRKCCVAQGYLNVPFIGPMKAMGLCMQIRDDAEVKKNFEAYLPEMFEYIPEKYIPVFQNMTFKPDTFKIECPEGSGSSWLKLSLIIGLLALVL